MKSFYEISAVKMQVSYTRYDINDDGSKRILTEQTIGYNGLMTTDELMTEAKARIEPGHDIEVVVSPKINI